LAYRLPIYTQFTGNLALRPALFVQGNYHLLLCHFVFVHRPIVGHVSSQWVGGFARKPAKFCPECAIGLPPVLQIESLTLEMHA